jgi:hypothetical protein
MATKTAPALKDAPATPWRALAPGLSADLAAGSTDLPVVAFLFFIEIRLCGLLAAPIGLRD